MSLGTLYGTTEIRALVPKALIKHYDLDVAIKSWRDPEFKANFPLGLRPAFLGSDGLELTQSIAIILYLLSFTKNKELLGKSDGDYAQIIQWMTFTNTETLPASIIVFDPIRGKQSHPQDTILLNESNLGSYMAIYETRLKDHAYLVGDTYTLADLYALALLIRPFEYLFDRAWRETHPFTTAWFERSLEQPILKDVREPFSFIDKRLPNKI